MVDPRFTALSMENHHPSTLLSMDSSASSHEELDLEMNNNRQVTLSRPPDINLPLSDRSSPSQLWNNADSCEILDVGFGSQAYETESYLAIPKVGRKCAKRIDSIWGAWFFFSFYFRPALNDKSKTKITRDSNGVLGFEKSDLKLDVFLVQHDMENMYMWVFKDRPENALGKMQLRSFMNGHSRQGERPFPFSVEKGFARSHRMQRKHYRGLSNPQCIHGVEFVPSPNLMCVDEEEKKRWIELTGRDSNFIIPPEASDFGSWRNLPNVEFELDRPLTQTKSKKLLNGSGLNLLIQPSNHVNGDSVDLSPSSKRRKDFFPHANNNNNNHEDDCFLSVNPPPDRISDMEIHSTEPLPHWLNDFSGVMKNVFGPVTAAKTIYEDEEGYLVIISLPFVDLNSVKVSWRNTLTHGILKVSCMSTSRMPFVKRHDRTFKLVDPSSEHCPPGEFVREIPLSTRIPEDGKIEAYYDGPGSTLEILVPKLRAGPEEHEVRVCLRPNLGGNDLMLT